MYNYQQQGYQHSRNLTLCLIVSSYRQIVVGKISTIKIFFIGNMSINFFIGNMRKIMKTTNNRSITVTSRTPAACSCVVFSTRSPLSPNSNYTSDNVAVFRLENSNNPCHFYCRNWSKWQITNPARHSANAPICRDSR